MGSITAPWAVCTATCRERYFGLSCARKQSFSNRTKRVCHETLSLYISILFIFPIYLLLTTLIFLSLSHIVIVISYS